MAAISWRHLPTRHKYKIFIFFWNGALQTKYLCEAGPKAERYKSSDLDCGQGDPGSNPGKAARFFGDSELSRS